VSARLSLPRRALGPATATRLGLARSAGFTLIELLVVMVIIATLLSIVAPRYYGTVDRAKEMALRTNLRILRDAIDKRMGDAGHYPDSLDQLVTERYLREVPVDPVTEKNDSWVIAPYPDKSKPGVYDVHSGATGNAADGTAYASW
jgi:general secretion pathway protein G